jgi:hypothetical protein
VPIELIRRMSEQRRALRSVHAPSRGALDLEYLSPSPCHEVVTEQALRDKNARATRAISIVEAASEGARQSMLPPGRMSKAPPPPGGQRADVDEYDVEGE